MHINYILLGILLSLLTTLPLAWKWQLGVLRVAWVVLALATVSSVIVALSETRIAIGAGLQSVLIWLITMVTAFSIFLSMPSLQTPIPPTRTSRWQAQSSRTISSFSLIAIQSQPT